MVFFCQRHLLEQGLAQHGMGIHELPFFVGEAAGFQQNVVWYANLAQIVHRRCHDDQVDL